MDILETLKVSQTLFSGAPTNYKVKGKLPPATPQFGYTRETANVVTLTQCVRGREDS